MLHKIIIVLLLLSATFFGAYFGSQKMNVVEKNVCQYDKGSLTIKESIPIKEDSKVESMTAINPSMVPSPTPNKKFEGRWGGIASSKNVYPTGATYNPSESGMYKVPVATGEGLWYIYIGGYWFDWDEYNKLPYEVRTYKYSPYSVSD